MEYWEIEFSDGTIERWSVNSEEELKEKLKHYCIGTNFTVVSTRKLDG